MADSDNIVTLTGIPLSEILEIVRYLRSEGILFEWVYYPHMPDYREQYVEFFFPDSKVVSWFILRYK